MKGQKNRFDNAWKDIVRDLFFEFLDFYYPDLSREVDHQSPPRSRDKELAKLLPDNLSSGRRADLLFQVRMISGEPRTLLLHIEVQNRKEEALEKRLFQYAYRIFDREGSFPATLLLLTDGDPHYFPTGYRVKLAMGKYLSLDFFTQKLLYLKEELQEAKLNQNPFAFITAAHLEALKAPRAEDQYRLKLGLTKRLICQGWELGYAKGILRFLDWMLQLPEGLESLYNVEAKFILEEDCMPYVTSWERRALKQGMEQGMDLGISQGELKDKRHVLCRLVEKKFGFSSSHKDLVNMVERVSDPEALDRAIDAVLDADSRDDVIGLLL